MKKYGFVFFAALGLAACEVTGGKELGGCWIETSLDYTQGMYLKDNGIAESVGMSSLLYQNWSVSDGKLILSGQSIGNGQTIQFSDTMEIVSVNSDTLIVERRGNNVVYVKKDFGILSSGCGTLSSGCTPSREACEGFVRKELNGAGLRLLVQENENISLVADTSLPGIYVVRKNEPYRHKVIQIFDLPGNDINDVIGELEKSDGWDSSQTCMFKEVESARSGVRRYVMLPDGDYKTKTDLQMKSEPVPFTCNGWGVGNSGMRYFEIHDSHPDKAIFVEIGQDAPLFDENSISFM